MKTVLSIILLITPLATAYGGEYDFTRRRHVRVTAEGAVFAGPVEPGIIFGGKATGLSIAAPVGSSADVVLSGGGLVYGFGKDDGSGEFLFSSYDEAGLYGRALLRFSTPGYVRFYAQAGPELLLLTWPGGGHTGIAAGAGIETEGYTLAVEYFHTPGFRRFSVSASFPLVR